MAYNKATTRNDSVSAAKIVKKFTVELGIHRELRLDSTASAAYTPDDILRIETYAEELANEKITGALYILGEPHCRCES